jgi:DNA-binding transcriptional regulator GbsR (MarR family)
MSNLSTSELSGDQVGFIDNLAALLIDWGMPNTAARLYGYLLLKNQPVTLDDMTRDLEISKSNACTAANSLEQQKNARRIRERGSKRTLYVLGEDPGAPLHKQLALLSRMSELISEQKSKVATGAVTQRMAKLAKFHHDLCAAMESVIKPTG